MNHARQKTISKICWGVFIFIISICMLAVSCADYGLNVPQNFTDTSGNLVDENSSANPDGQQKSSYNGDVKDGVDGDTDPLIADPIDTTSHVSSDTAVIIPFVGGKVVIDSMKGENYLDIPPNALDEETEITIDVFDVIPVGVDNIEHNKSYDFLFGPKGLVFTVPATLALDQQAFYNPAYGPPIEICWEYYDTSTGEWVDKTLVPISPDKKFYITVTHFSIYRATVTKYGGLSPSGQ